MSKNTDNEMDDELRPEYNLSQLQGGVRGKYASRYREGTNLILLEPDVAAVFKNNEFVNEALRLLIKIADSKCLKAVQPGVPADSQGSAPLHPENH